MELPVLKLCPHPGCRRWTHLRFCPDHVDDDLRVRAEQLDEALLELDLARDRAVEAGERVRVLEGEVGIRRPGGEVVPLDGL